MAALLIQLIIVLIVAGVFVWGARKILALIPMDPWIKQVCDTLIIIVVVIIVVFYALIPILKMLGAQLHM